MALSKDQKQKLLLGAIFLGAGLYAYFEFGLGPLNRDQELADKEIVALNPKLADADKKIKARDVLKARVPQAEAFLNQVNKMIPQGAPVAWFPTLVDDFFKARGGERVLTRMLNEVADPVVEGYQRISWSVEIPKGDFIEFAASLAEFENQQPLVECQSVIVEFKSEDPQNQRISMNLANSVKK
jgi:hypothetical protein